MRLCETGKKIEDRIVLLMATLRTFIVTNSDGLKTGGKRGSGRGPNHVDDGGEKIELFKNSCVQ